MLTRLKNFFVSRLKCQSCVALSDWKTQYCKELMQEQMKHEAILNEAHKEIVFWKEKALNFRRHEQGK